LENAFNEENRVRCFNHTTQLSAKTLLKPFNAGLASGKSDDGDIGADSLPPLEDLEDDDENDDNSGEPVEDDVEDDVDELEELSEEDRDKILTETAAVRETVSKVGFMFYISIRLYSDCLIASEALIRHH
jgi:hypothetical protein